MYLSKDHMKSMKENTGFSTYYLSNMELDFGQYLIGVQVDC